MRKRVNPEFNVRVLSKVKIPTVSAVTRSTLRNLTAKRILLKRRGMELYLGKDVILIDGGFTAARMLVRRGVLADDIIPVRAYYDSQLKRATCYCCLWDESSSEWHRGIEAVGGNWTSAGDIKFALERMYFVFVRNTEVNHAIVSNLEGKLYVGR